jgi:nitrate/nitrite transporter NarK
VKLEEARAPGAPGALAWLAFGFAVAFFCYAFLQRVAPAVMVSDLMRDFAVGGAVLGNLSAFYFYAYAALQIPVGLLLDRFGPRRLMTGAALVCAAGSFVFAVADQLVVAYAGRLLIGAGCAISFVGALAVATTWFPARRFAMLTGMAQAGAMAGAVLGAAPLAALLQTTGWRSVMLGAAALSASLAVAMWLTARDGPSARRSTVGLAGALKVVASNPQTWLAAGFGFFITGPMLAFTSLWGASYLQAVYGLDRPTAAGAVSLSFVGWGLCAPLIGLLSDRLGARRPIMIVGSMLSFCTNAAIIWLTDLSLVAISAVLLINGAVSCCMLLNFVCAKEHNPPWASGAAIGFSNTAVMLSGAILQPVVGLLLDLNWEGAVVDGARVYDAATFRTALSILPICSIVAIAMAWILREPPRPPQ